MTPTCNRCGSDTLVLTSLCDSCRADDRERAAHEFDQESGVFLGREVNAMLRFGASPVEIRRIVESEILAWGQGQRRVA